jgi:hypothetical protein
VHHVVKTLAASPGALLVCRALARADGLIGPPTRPQVVLAGAVLGPHLPGFHVVDNPTANPPRGRLSRTRRCELPGREGTCRLPT